MSRTYLRYEPDITRGVIVTSGGCAAHPSGQKVFVAAHDTINVWSTTSGTRLATYESCIDAYVVTLIHHPTINFAAAGMSNGRVLVFDTSLPMMDLLYSFLPSNSSVSALAFSSDAMLLFAGTVGAEIFVHDLVEGQIIYKLKGGHSGPITRLAMMDSRHLVSASRDKLVVLWDLTTHSKMQTLTECYSEVRAICVYMERKDGSEVKQAADKGKRSTKEKRELRSEELEAASVKEQAKQQHQQGTGSSEVQLHDDDYDWFLFAGCADNTIHAWSTCSMPPSLTLLQVLSETTEPNSIAYKYLDLLTRLGYDPRQGGLQTLNLEKDLGNALNDNRSRIIHSVDTVKEAKELLTEESKALKYLGHMDKTISEPTISISLVHLASGAGAGGKVMAFLVVSAKTVELYKIGSMSQVLTDAKRRIQRHARQKVEKLLSACEVDRDTAQYEVADTMRNHLLSESATLLSSTTRSIQASDFLTSSLLIKSVYGEKLIDAVLIPRQNSICFASTSNFLQFFHVLTRDAANATVRGAIAGGTGTGANALRDSAYTYEETLDISLPGHRHVIHHASLSADDTLVITCAQGEVKVWSIRQFVCIATITLPKAMRPPTRVVMLVGNKYSVVADTAGMLGLIDNVAAEMIDLVEAHTKHITDLQLVDGELLSASEDGFVKFWSFRATEESNITFRLEREFDVGHAISAIRVDGPKKHVLCALYDNTVRIHFLDTLRFKLILYGHSMPITSMAIAESGERLITCSLDKTIRIWGLNFGECQKIMRFESPFTDIAFIRDTRLGIAASKDGQLTYWDLDHFVLISILGVGNHGSYFSRGHFGECTSLCVSRTGRFIISVGHDRAIRQWIQTEDLVNPSIEEQKRFQDVMDKEEDNTLGWEDPDKLKRSREGKNAGDILMEATILVNNEIIHNRAREKSAKGDNQAQTQAQAYVSTYGKPPLEYLLSVMKTEIQHEILFDALMSMTVGSARTLLRLLSQMLEEKYQPADFIVRCASFLITRYFSKAADTEGLAVLVQKTQHRIHESLRRQESEARTALGCLEIMRSLLAGVAQ